MRVHKQASSQFSLKLGAILAKLKDHSTVQVAHEQIRSLLSEHPIRQIFNGFISKMDTGEQTSQRERKEYCKVYISLMEVYKEQVLSETYFGKMIESVGRKQSGVSEVIGHLCKMLLSRVQQEQTLMNYLHCILNVFLPHPELPKVLRQIIDTVDPGVLASLQGQIMNLLAQKVTATRNRHDFVESVHALVLALEQRLQIDAHIIHFVLKLMKNDDWSCRKACVDICYAMLLIRSEPSEPTLPILKQLKYDKIKHVREAVNNYQTLYRQIVGEELLQKISARQDRIRSHQPQIDKTIGERKSPVSPRNTQNLKSKDKTPQKKKNQRFFKNAKDSNIILTNESVKLPKQQHRIEKEMEVTQVPLGAEKEYQQNLPQQDFQAYLQSRCDQRQESNGSMFKVKEPQINLSLSLSQGNSIEPLKFSYKRELDNFRKKNRAGTQMKVEEGNQPHSVISEAHRDFDSVSISRVEEKYTQPFEELKQMMVQFQETVTSRLDSIEGRLSVLERQKQVTQSHGNMVDLSTFSSRSSIAVQEHSLEVGAESMLCGTLQSGSEFGEGQGVESNLQQKIRTCLQMENWDEAYTIALTNNKRNILLNLLQRCVFPKDKMVEECILLQIRKLLGYTGALKWLKYFLTQRTIEKGRLIRIREDLLKRHSGDKNYSMMRQMLLNQIGEKLMGSSHSVHSRQ